MKYIVLVVALFCIAVPSAQPYQLFEDEQVQEYRMVPQERERRQTKFDVTNQGVLLGHRGTILDNDNHRLDGSAYAAKSFKSPGLRPDQMGGRLDYLHKPSRSEAFVSADNMRGYGTDVNVGGKVNLYENDRKNFHVDLGGKVGQRFGGPGGAGEPHADVMLEGRLEF